MKIITLICITLIYSQASICQNKLSNYNSVLNLDLLNKVDVDQHIRIETNLEHIGNVDPSLIYFFLLGNYPNNSHYKKVFRNQFASAGLNVNNYLTSYQDMLLRNNVSQYIISSFIVPEISSIKVPEQDLKSEYLSDSLIATSDLENIFFYYRIVHFSEIVVEKYNPDKKYKVIFQNEIRSYYDSVSTFGSAFGLEYEKQIPQNLIHKLISISSLLNVIGENEYKNRFEQLTVSILISYQKILTVYGKESIKNGKILLSDLPRMVKISFGYKFVFGLNKTETYNIDDPQYGNFGLPMIVNQDFTNAQLIGINVKINPFFFANYGDYLKMVNVNFSFASNFGLLKSHTINSIDESTKSNYVSLPHFNLGLTKNLYDKYTEYNIPILFNSSLNFPIYSLSQLVDIDVGMAYFLGLVKVKSSFKYSVSIIGKYTDTSDHINVLFNEESKVFSRDIAITSFHPFMSIRSASYNPLQCEIVLGLENSFLRIGLEI